MRGEYCKKEGLTKWQINAGVEKSGTLGELVAGEPNPAEVAGAKLPLDLVQPNPVTNRKVPRKSPYSLESLGNKWNQANVFTFEYFHIQCSPFPCFIVFEIPGKLGVEPSLTARLPRHAVPRCRLENPGTQTHPNRPPCLACGKWGARPWLSSAVGGKAEASRLIREPRP